MLQSFRRPRPPAYRPAPPMQRPCCPCPPNPCPPPSNDCCWPEPPCPPQRPDRCGPKWLLPRVVVSGQFSQRCMPECLRVSGLPCGLCPPFTILGIEPTCEQPSVRIQEDCWGPCRFVAEVTIPLTVWVCDGCGQKHCGIACITICVRMQGLSRDRCGNFLAAARVRLVDPGCPMNTPVFNVRLSVVAEVYMVRLEPCGQKDRCEKRCHFPDKPFYPQPFYLDTCDG